jgi:FKBP-type peptidyl-prolyl cis-trans isomerase
MKLIKKGFHTCLLLILGLALFSSCKDEYQERFKKQQQADDTFIQEYLKANNIQNAQRQASGVYYIPLTPGNGTRVQKTSNLELHSIGRLLNYGSAKFESTYENGKTRDVKLGLNQMVKGLEEGLSLMQEGEKAKIIVPSGLGYGQAGNYTTIPGNAVLLYEIYLVDIK